MQRTAGGGGGSARLRPALLQGQYRWMHERQSRMGATPRSTVTAVTEKG